MPARIRLHYAAAIALLAINISAQEPKVLAPHRPIPQRINKKIDWSKKATPRSMIGGLWITDANFKSSIYLRSVVETDPITVTPILWLANGTKYTLPNVTLDPAGIAIIDINAGLQQQGISPWATLSGYVELQYTWPWDPLCATIRDVDVTHSLIFTFGMRTTTPLNPKAVSPATAQPSTQTLEGMWWKEEKNVTGFVALTNTSSQPIQASVELGDQLANPIAQHNVTISPHGMKLVNLQELPGLPLSVGGIHISYTGPTDALIVNGGVEDESVGYSAGLAFSSPLLRPDQLPPHAKLTQFTSFAELGLMTGASDPMMKFPAGTTFTPYSVVRNISDALLSLTPTIWWMQNGQAQSARLQPIQLLPSQSQALNVPAMLAQAGLSDYNGSFNLTFGGNLKRGSLLTAAGSVDQTKTYVFEVTPRGVAESVSKSLQYWSTGNGDDTMITLWNPADEAQDFIFKLFFTGGHYLVPVHLEARATRTINVSDIVMNPAPDAEGNTIPPTIHEGSIKITGSHAENQSILVSIDAGIYNVHKATCGMDCYTCDGYSDWAVNPDTFTVDVGNETSLAFVAIYDGGTTYTFLTDDASWETSDSSVATVNSDATVTGVGSGTVTIAAIDQFDTDYATNVCVPSGSPDPCPVGTGGGGEAGGTVPNPSVTISLQSSGTVSNTNSALDVYDTEFGTEALGVQANAEAKCFGGVQLTGAVTPSNYNGTLVLHRTLESCGTYKNSSTSVSCPAPMDDTSDPPLRDDDPSSSSGNIYDLDGPGVGSGNQAGSVYRYRANFQEYATLPDGTTTVSTAPLNYYVRLSCKFDASGNPSLDTTVSGDNQIGLGTTKTSWNLQ